MAHALQMQTQVSELCPFFQGVAGVGLWARWKVAGQVKGAEDVTGWWEGWRQVVPYSVHCCVPHSVTVTHQL